MNLSIDTTLDCNVLAVGITICVSPTRGPRLGQPHLVTRSRINGGRGLLVVKLLGKFKVAGYACGWWGGVVSVIFILPSFQFVFDSLLGSSAKLRDHVHPADLRRDTPTIWRLQPLRWCIIVWSLFYSLLCELLEMQGRSLEEMRGWVRTPSNCGKKGRKNSVVGYPLQCDNSIDGGCVYALVVFDREQAIQFRNINQWKRWHFSNVSCQLDLCKSRAALFLYPRSRSGILKEDSLPLPRAVK